MSELTCPICSTIFTPKRNNQKYCSYECYEKAKNQKKKVYDPEKQRKWYLLRKIQPKQRLCLNCGKNFIDRKLKLCDDCRNELVDRIVNNENPQYPLPVER